jgi:hypothetical protein
LFGIKLLLASERRVIVGWSLAIGLCYGRWHEVVGGGKIYICTTDGGGLGGMLRGKCKKIIIYKCDTNRGGLKG